VDEHKIELWYTNDDDGIHLVCACGWRHCAGFFATPEQVMELATAHREEIASAVCGGVDTK